MENSPRSLSAKRLPVLFLGSSVTYGSAAGGWSFADALAEQYGLPILKEAVSGTTLVDDNDQSYIARLLRLPADVHPAALVCQLSTNDAAQGKPLGEIRPGMSPDGFDPHTITGAMEFIIAHARETWGCPVFFYTGTRFDSPAYARMVVRLQELAAKWPITLIDLWNDPAMNAVSPQDYARYMHDPVHPTREGYLTWWTPRFARALRAYL